MDLQYAITAVSAMGAMVIWMTAESVLGIIKIWTAAAPALEKHLKMSAAFVMEIRKMIIAPAPVVLITMQKTLIKMQSLMIAAVSTQIILFMCPVNTHISRMPSIMPVLVIQ